MGIQGLLKAIERIFIERHLKCYINKKIAVDGYSWLHKSVFLMSDDILTNPDSKRFLVYLNRRLDQLLRYNIKPVIVFDGDKLPMKKVEEDERQNHRQIVTEKGHQLLNLGLVKEAQTKMIEGLDINPQMAYEWIQELKRRNIEYYVAPYEADGQLAYLSKNNFVDCILTEDSDLVALGCRKILCKLDIETGIGKEISYERISKCKAYNFEKFGEDRFLTFCILSGCDYFKIKGIGIKNAYKIINSSSSFQNCWELIKKNYPNVVITNEIKEQFEKAFLTFRYQVVYCPKRKEMVYSNSITEGKYKFIEKYKKDLSFLGKIYDKEITRQIVFGEIDPITHMRFDSGKMIQNVQYNIININNNNVKELTMNVIASNENALLNKKRNNDYYKELRMNAGLPVEEEEEDSSNEVSDIGEKRIDEEDSLKDINEFDDFFNKFEKIDKKVKKSSIALSIDNEFKMKKPIQQSTEESNKDLFFQENPSAEDNNKKFEFVDRFKFNQDNYKGFL